MTENHAIVRLLDYTYIGALLAQDKIETPRPVIEWLAKVAHMRTNNDELEAIITALLDEADAARDEKLRAEEWIMVEDRLPDVDDREPDLMGSIDVEAKDNDGKIYPCAWCGVDPEERYYKEWVEPLDESSILGEERKIDNIVAWRPMRGE